MDRFTAAQNDVDRVIQAAQQRTEDLARAALARRLAESHNGKIARLARESARLLRRAAAQMDAIAIRDEIRPKGEHLWPSR
jgi:hypothetical protein